MSNIWQVSEEMVNRSDQSGSLWLKLANDGDKVVVVFLGDPYPREVVFDEGRYLPYDAKAKEAGRKPTIRLALNVALFPSREGKVFEFGGTFFKSLLQLRGKYGLNNWAYEITRHGAAKDPKTSYSILPERQLSPDEERSYQALRLQDLQKLYPAVVPAQAAHAIGSYDRPAAPPPAAAPAPQPLAAAAPAPQPLAAAAAAPVAAPPAVPIASPPVPTAAIPTAAPAPPLVIDPAVAQELSGHLKTLPRAAVDRFLAQFGIQRVKDLAVAHLPAARGFLSQLAREFGLPDPSGDVDPFS